MRLPRHVKLLLSIGAVLHAFIEPNDSFLIADEVPSIAASVQSRFQQSCIECHGKDGQVNGEVNLVSIGIPQDLLARPEFIQELIKVIDSGYMPPVDAPQLSSNERDLFVLELKKLLRSSASAPPPGTVRTAIRRMNRFQYNNSVQDLFRLKVDVFPLPERMLREHGNYFQPQSRKMPPQLKAGSRPLEKFQIIERQLGGVTPFPQDLRAEHGFDNRGDHLTLSPLLLDSFIHLSKSIVESPEFNEKTCGIWPDFFSPPTSLRPEDIDSAVQDRLRRFLTRAFRRPVEDAVVQRYARQVFSKLEAGESFVDAMKNAAATAIASPRFFYLYELASSDERDYLDDSSIASRLSFFLWGSIPDETLVELAAAGRLREPEVLRHQVNRMLRDERLKRFCDSFPSQWLQLERIISSEPDPELFPHFYFLKYRASMHMMLEPLLLFETVLIENMSVLQLIDSDFSYRSDLLEAWYRDGSQGIPGPPTQVTLRRVPITDRRQGGVITTAAVLTMTSGPIRTKPITRGAWLATVILNDPPAPPPGDVLPLSDKPSDGDKELSLRERFVAHRKERACLGCHQRIDPLGFALENFDPVGIWRDNYENGRPVDASGKLFGKHAFQNVIEFKDALLAEKDRFTLAFAGHLLSFATGRKLTFIDAASLDKIVSEAADDDYRIQTILQQVVLSDSFRR
jgi:hypothetical protein